MVSKNDKITQGNFLPRSVFSFENLREFAKKRLGKELFCRFFLLLDHVMLAKQALKG